MTIGQLLKQARERAGLTQCLHVDDLRKIIQVKGWAASSAATALRRVGVEE